MQNYYCAAHVLDAALPCFCWTATGVLQCDGVTVKSGADDADDSLVSTIGYWSWDKLSHYCIFDDRLRMSRVLVLVFPSYLLVYNP